MQGRELPLKLCEALQPLEGYKTCKSSRELATSAINFAPQTYSETHSDRWFSIHPFSKCLNVFYKDQRELNERRCRQITHLLKTTFVLNK